MDRIGPTPHLHAAKTGYAKPSKRLVYLSSEGSSILTSWLQDLNLRAVQNYKQLQQGCHMNLTHGILRTYGPYIVAHTSYSVS